jgi:DNA invertase Pin-like site-specific DNA recombinase
VGQIKYEQRKLTTDFLGLLSDKRKEVSFFMPIRKKSSYAAAIYLRLSDEDGTNTESNSIHNQRELIRDFLKHHPEITKTQEFVDDGYSGTNFERPAFIRMMNEIENHRLDCIIVKDLSRFGRNYIETGKYLERIFPMMEVRFIAITDNYDNANEIGDADQIVIPFKNLINDAYCRDMSIKIRSHLDVKRKNGKFIGSFAGYGYQKDPVDHNHLVIDEYAAGIVRMIFSMKLEGSSSGRIAQKLNEMGVLTPMEYKRACGMNFNSGYQASRHPVWTPSSVIQILKNEVYIGTVVQGKNKKINYKVKESRPVEQTQWIRVAGMHEAIIPAAIFENVQELLKLDTRTAPAENTVDAFSGLVRCGDCGQNMIRRSTSKNGKKYYYYHCTTYKNRLGCSAHLISAEKLYEAVLWQTQVQIAKLVEADAFLKEMECVPQEHIQIRALNNQIVALQSEVERYSELKLKVYQDMADQIVTKAEYQELCGRFNLKIESAKQAQREIEEKKSRLDIGNFYGQSWIENFKQYQNITALDRRQMVELIDHITVYSKDRIEIQFRYMDEMEILLDFVARQTSRTEGQKAI